MLRRSHSLVAGLTLAALFVAPACGGGTSASVEPAAEVEAPAALPAELVAATWPVQLVEAEARSTYESRAWVDLFLRREYNEAVEGFGSEGGLSVARAHADAAAVYRQAALMAANAYVETYAKTPQQTDPVGVAHPVAVSYALRGELDEARKWSARLDAAESPVDPWHAPWKAWMAADGGPTWPPDLSALPLEVPAVAVGTWPEVSRGPHYSLKEQGVDSTLDLSDPGVLVALALWHEGAAEKAAADQAGVVDAYLARYRFPVEPAVSGAPAFPMEFVFGSDYPTPADGPFVADLTGAAGSDAVEKHAATSLLAAAAQASRVNGKLSHEKALDTVAALRDALIKEQVERAGSPEGHHRIFADVVQVGALRVLALVAEAEGDRETSGILRINAMERSVDAAAAPEGLLSLAAWDAANRYPGRGTEIIHQQVKQYPSLAIARYGLEVLAIRVSRERGGAMPGM